MRIELPHFVARVNIIPYGMKFKGYIWSLLY